MTIARNRIPSLNMYHMKIGMATIAYIMVRIFPRSVFGTISPYPINILSKSYIWKNVQFIELYTWILKLTNLSLYALPVVDCIEKV